MPSACDHGPHLREESVETMRIAILSHRERLEELNRTLDARVRERTQALEAAREQLVRTERLASIGLTGKAPAA